MVPNPFPDAKCNLVSLSTLVGVIRVLTQPKAPFDGEHVDPCCRLFLVGDIDHGNFLTTGFDGPEIRHRRAVVIHTHGTLPSSTSCFLQMKVK